MSEFVVSARKYRPVRFDEVVGQEHVSLTLKNALKQGRLAHAFLFCGPRGVGKTTNARILAKVLNCLNVSDDFEPCNTCDNCLAFNQSASFNIFELDGASHNKVDHMHQLMEQVRIPPQSGRKKVYIIDEVHMLSQAAFNAFLKTLEEPPEYAVFILATTEKHKILPTILSRCQTYDFHRIKPEDMVAHLQTICQDQGITAEIEALHLVAEKADGALRDALSIFDRLVSSSQNNELTYTHAVKQLNVLDHSTYFSVVDALLREDAGQLYLLFDKVLNNGFEPEPFLEGLAKHIRQLFVCKSPDTTKLLIASDQVKEKYVDQASKASISFLINALNLAAECEFRLKSAANKRLHVEIYLIKMAYLQRTISKDFVATPDLQKKNLNQSKSNSSISVAHTASVSSDVVKPNQNVVKTIANEKNSSLSNDQEKEKDVPPSNKNIKKNLVVTPSISFDEDDEDLDAKDHLNIKPEELSIDKLKEKWNEGIKNENSHVAAMMEKSELSYTAPKFAIRIGSKFGENLLKTDCKTLKSLKEDLQCRELVIQINFDESLAPKEAKTQTILSDKDKYQLMLDSNEHLSDFQKRMDLIFA